MNDLSVLTPPALICAAFLFALGAFLRHEMRAGRGRSKRARFDDISEDDPELDDHRESYGWPERSDDA
jgi:hypothetical protein